MYQKYIMNIEDELLTEDNREILELLVGRLRLGKKRYGHGVTVSHDTRNFGTKDDSWVEMNLEEILDGMIYMCAATLRLRREMRRRREGGGGPAALTMGRDGGGDILSPGVVETDNHPMGSDAFESLSQVSGFNEANGATYAEYCLGWLKRSGRMA